MKKGATFVTWWFDSYLYSKESLEALAALGCKEVGILVTVYQDNYQSSDPRINILRTPTDASIILLATWARELGMNVTLKPHVDLLNDPTHWRGQIDPEDPDMWWEYYNAFIERYARLSVLIDAKLFIIGTELCEMTKPQYSSRWRELIKRVRLIVKCPITYGANWGEEVLRVDWWDALDFIGCDAWYPLSGLPEPLITDLVKGWSNYKLQLKVLSGRFGKKVLFTEIGYASSPGAALHPWVVDNEIVDFAIQKKCYQAMVTAFKNQTSWWEGALIWAWDAVGVSFGPSDNGYNPRNKPVEEVLRSWFK